MLVVLIAVISLDGRITPPNEAGPGFASPEDQAWFRAALREFDCSVMGPSREMTAMRTTSMGWRSWKTK